MRSAKREIKRTRSMPEIQNRTGEFMAVNTTFSERVSSENIERLPAAKRHKILTEKPNAPIASSSPNTEANIQEELDKKPAAIEDVKPIMPVRNDLPYLSGANKDNANARDNLCNAAINNDPDKIKELLESGVSVNVKYSEQYEKNSTWRGMTAVHYAALHNCPDAIRQLAISGANLNATCDKTNSDGIKIVRGVTALHGAAIKNCGEAITELAKHQGLNTNPSMRKSDGWPIKPIHEAASNDSPDAIRALISDCDASPNKQVRITKKTPLHFAVKNNSSNAVRALLENDRTDVNASDCNGKEPLEIALQKAEKFYKDDSIERSIAVDLKKAGGRANLDYDARKKFNSMLNDMIQDSLDSNPDKIRDMLFLEAEVDLKEYSFAQRETIKQLQKEANEIPIKGRENSRVKDDSRCVIM